MIYVNILFLLI